MKTTHFRSKKTGFTLVELLTVVTIIVILAGITIGALSWIPRLVATKRAEAQVKLLDHALQRCLLDIGELPEVRDGTGMAMYYVLSGDGVGADGILGNDDDGPIDGKPDIGAKVYLAQLNPGTNSLGLLEVGGNGIPTRVVDPFGNSWLYSRGAKFHHLMNNTDYDIHSPGADGRGTPMSPGADDIHNW